MNISISLLKRTGLTKEQIKSELESVYKMRDSVKDEMTKLEAELGEIKSDVGFWKREMKKRQPTRKCTKCESPINLWPFEDTSYYVEGNKVSHKNCPGIKE